MATQSEAVEVVVSWDGNPLDTAVVRGEGALRIGPGAGVWFSLPVELLAADHTLLARDDGRWVLAAPAGATLNAARCGAKLETDGRVVLDPATTAEVELGRFSFFVRTSDSAIERMPKSGASYRWTTWLGVAAALHGIVLGLFALTPRDAAALNLDPSADEVRYIHMALDAVEQPEPPVVVAPSSADEGGGGGDEQGGELGGGEADEVSEGSTNAPRRDHGRRQPTFIPNPANISELGVIALLNQQSWGDDLSPYSTGNGRDGTGGMNEMADLLRMPRGPEFGGLRLETSGHGTCDPRRERCEGGIGVGPLVTGDPGRDGGEGDIDLPGRRPPRGIEFRPLPPQTVGGLSQEEVRRTVRRHVNEVRFCYEQALVRRPDAQGRVSVRFIIAPSGAVQSAASDSTVSDGQIGTCVEQAVRRWTFPQSPGTTGVTYPFTMQPSD